MKQTLKTFVYTELNENSALRSINNKERLYGSVNAHYEGIHGGRADYDSVMRYRREYLENKMTPKIETPKQKLVFGQSLPPSLNINPYIK